MENHPENAPVNELLELSLSSFITYTNSATTPQEIAKNKKYKLLLGLKYITSLYGITNCSNEVRIWNPGHPTHEKVITKRCGNRQSCPPCTSRYMAKHRKSLAKAMQKQRTLGGDVCTGALTIQIPKGTRLEESIKILKQSWTLMTKSGSFPNLLKKHKILGYARIAEQKLINHTWFPHFHMLWLSETPLSQLDIDGFGAELATLWAKYAGKAGAANTLAANQSIYAVTRGTEQAKANYLCKHGYFDLNKDLDIYPAGHFELEPFEVLEISLITGQAEFAEKWEEYELATNGLKRVNRSRHFRGVLVK